MVKAKGYMRGGKRLGAGRKQGFAAKNAEDARRILSEMVMRDIEPIGKALIAKAKKGDVIAVRELFDRAFGKAPQTSNIDLSSQGMPVPILSGLSFDPAFDEASRNRAIYGGLSSKSTDAAV